MVESWVNARDVERESSVPEPASKVIRRPCPVAWSLIGVNILIFFGLPIVFRSWFPYRRESLGAEWGPLIFMDGQWWRLLTSSFVHFEGVHLSGNMLALLVLGSRLEREVGKWIFLLFYLTCDLVVGLSILALRPDIVSNGASGAVVGLLGGLIAIYGARLRALSWYGRGKYLVLVIFAVDLVRREFSRGDLLLAHTVGLVTGVLLGSFLLYVARTSRARYWTFIGLVPLMVGAAIVIQRYHRMGGWPAH